MIVQTAQAPPLRCRRRQRVVGHAFDTLWARLRHGDSPGWTSRNAGGSAVLRLRFLTRQRVTRHASLRRVRHRHGARRAWVSSSLPVVACAVCVISAAAVAGWLASGGSFTEAPGRLTPGVDMGGSPAPPDAVSVHLTSAPSGADVRVDGTRRGVTPAQLALSPRAHTLLVHAPDSVDLAQTFEVSTSGAAVSANLWRVRPDVVPVRPVYPGAQMLDAQCIADDSLVFRIDSGASNTTAAPALWQLSSPTNGFAPILLPPDATLAAIAPDGKHVAYATGAAQLSSTLWATGPIELSTTAPTEQAPSVVLRGANGATERKIKIAVGQRTAPEHVTDVVWTPDEPASRRHDTHGHYASSESAAPRRSGISAF